MAGRRRATGRRRQAALDIAGRGRARGPPDRPAHHRAAGADEPAPPAGADARRRRARRGRGAAAKAVAGRPPGGAGPASKALSLPARQRPSGSATASTTAPPRRSPTISTDRGSLRYLAAGAGRCAARCSPPRGSGRARTRISRSCVRSLPAPVPRLFEVRASGEDGALAGPRDGDHRARRQHRSRSRLPMPSELRNRTTRIEVEGGQSAGGVLLVDERWRRRPVGIAATAERRRAAAAQRELLPRTRARPVHRNPARPRPRAAQAPDSRC